MPRVAVKEAMAERLQSIGSESFPDLLRSRIVMVPKTTSVMKTTGAAIRPKWSEGASERAMNSFLHRMSGMSNIAAATE
ncbi:hypothetical protein D3C87_2076890 [compost metagenome]